MPASALRHDRARARRGVVNKGFIIIIRSRRIYTLSCCMVVTEVDRKGGGGYYNHQWWLQFNDGFGVIVDRALSFKSESPRGMLDIGC